MHPVYEHIKSSQEVFDDLKVRVREREGIKALMNDVVNNRFNKVEKEIKYNERALRIRDILRHQRFMQRQMEEKAETE